MHRSIADRKDFAAESATSTESSYEYDALDRQTRQKKKHGATAARTTNFNHLGLTDKVTKEEQSGDNGVTNRTKDYSYDAIGTSVAMTAAGGVAGRLAKAGVGRAVSRIKQRQGGKSDVGSVPAGNAESTAASGDDWLAGVKAKVPSHWGAGKPTKKGEGRRWEDPDDSGNTIRVDRGNPDHHYSTQQVDHVSGNHRGKVIGRDGKPMPSVRADHNMSHIPKAEYENWTSWHQP